MKEANILSTFCVILLYTKKKKKLFPCLDDSEISLKQETTFPCKYGLRSQKHMSYLFFWKALKRQVLTTHKGLLVCGELILIPGTLSTISSIKKITIPLPLCLPLSLVPHSYPLRHHRRKLWWWVVLFCLPACLSSSITQQGRGTAKTTPEADTAPQGTQHSPWGYTHEPRRYRVHDSRGIHNQIKQLPRKNLRLGAALTCCAVILCPVVVPEAWSTPPGRPHWPHTGNSCRPDKTATSHLHPSRHLSPLPFILHKDTKYITRNYLEGRTPALGALDKGKRHVVWPPKRETEYGCARPAYFPLFLAFFVYL